MKRGRPLKVRFVSCLRRNLINRSDIKAGLALGEHGAVVRRANV